MFWLQIENGITHQLARAVIRNVATTIHLDKVGPHFTRYAFQVFVEVGTWPIGKYVRVLEQQQMLFARVFKK